MDLLTFMTVGAVVLSVPGKEKVSLLLTALFLDPVGEEKEKAKAKDLDKEGLVSLIFSMNWRMCHLPEKVLWNANCGWLRRTVLSLHAWNAFAGRSRPVWPDWLPCSLGGIMFIPLHYLLGLWISLSLSHLPCLLWHRLWHPWRRPLYLPRLHQPLKDVLLAVPRSPWCSGDVLDLLMILQRHLWTLERLRHELPVDLAPLCEHLGCLVGLVDLGIHALIRLLALGLEMPWRKTKTMISSLGLCSRHWWLRLWFLHPLCPSAVLCPSCLVYLWTRHPRICRC
jgi:hypothetical protein